MADKKYQLSVFAGGQSFHFRTDNSEDVKQFCGIEELNAVTAADFISKLNNSINRVETKVVKEAPAKCAHKKTKEMSGTTKHGKWFGLKCQDCGASNFKNRSKDGGHFWSGWKMKDGTKVPPPKEEKSYDLEEKDLPF